MTRKQYAETHRNSSHSELLVSQRKTQREARPARPVVPPTATSQEIQPVATEDTAVLPAPAMVAPSIQTIPLRRSQRQTKSTFDGHLKDYAK